MSHLAKALRGAIRNSQSNMGEYMRKWGARGLCTGSGRMRLTVGWEDEVVGGRLNVIGPLCLWTAQVMWPYQSICPIKASFPSPCGCFGARFQSTKRYEMRRPPLVSSFDL
jgi:hypothetical protein